VLDCHGNMVRPTHSNPKLSSEGVQGRGKPFSVAD
jgi:hypothetical protein